MENFEIVLRGNLELGSGYNLWASTNLTQTYNIIAEGLDYSYPTELPPVCCNFRQNKFVMGHNTTSGTTIADVFTAPALAAPSNGSLIKTVTLKALQSTTDNGMVKLYITPDGVTYYLIKEILIPRTNQSAFEPSHKIVLDMNYCLAPAYRLAVSTTVPNASFACTVEATSWSYPI